LKVTSVVRVCADNWLDVIAQNASAPINIKRAALLTRFSMVPPLLLGLRVFEFCLTSESYRRLRLKIPHVFNLRNPTALEHRENYGARLGVLEETEATATSGENYLSKLSLCQSLCGWELSI
jgi:hypothetical protein